LGLSGHASTAREVVVERVKSMFSPYFMQNPNAITLSFIDFKLLSSGPFVAGFFICPDCNQKYMLNIKDMGKVVKH